MITLTLTHSCVPAKLVYLRALTGADENLLDGVGLTSAIQLLSRLLVKVGDSLLPEQLMDLATTDFNRLLVALYKQLYGDQVISHLVCNKCNTPFDHSSSLNDFMVNESLHQVKPLPSHLGWFISNTGSGCRFRLPTIGELVAKPSSKTLMQLCVARGCQFSSEQEAALVFNAAGAMTNKTIQVRCPHCQFLQTFKFELADLFTQLLMNEKPFLVHDIHCIASAYQWSHQDILALSRNDRHAYVKLIRQKSPTTCNIDQQLFAPGMKQNMTSILALAKRVPNYKTISVKCIA